MSNDPHHQQQQQQFTNSKHAISMVARTEEQLLNYS